MADMLASYLMLDLETTGGSPECDRIIEIAAVRVEQGREVSRWSTLVNPGRWISPFITSLTGIDNAMVADAPRFETVAGQLMELLEGTVLVAHNARFDHGFLKNAFLRLQIDLRVRQLCTVRLSRKLYPQHRGHGLDAIMRRHGLHSLQRHRAMGDVDAVLQWLALANGELGSEPVRQAAQALVSRVANVPSHLEAVLQDLPQGPGVYLLYGTSPQPLHIGKSKHLRTSVSAHFQSDPATRRAQLLASETRRVDIRRTAGELGAALLEATLSKGMVVKGRDDVRRTTSACIWEIASDPMQAPQLQLVELTELQHGLPDPAYGIFTSPKAARLALLQSAQANGLDPRLLVLEPAAAHCSTRDAACCASASGGAMDPAVHLLRIQIAMAAHRLPSWPFPGCIGLREHDPHTGRTDIHVFDRWCHVGTVHGEAELQDTLDDAAGTLHFDATTFQLLRKRLSGSPSQAFKGLLRLDRRRSQDARSTQGG